MATDSLNEIHRLVVLGGTGFVGQHLARHLSALPRLDVVFAVHRNEPVWLKESGLAVAYYHVNDANSLSAILQYGCTVVNLLRPDGTGWFESAISCILDACAQVQVARYIHVSSIDVFGAATGQTMNAATAIRPMTPYEKEHAAGEAAAMEHRGSFDVVIARLGAVFGIGGLNVVSFVNEAANAPTWKLSLRRALYGRRRMHLVSVERVVQSLLYLVRTSGLARREIILVTDDEVTENNFAFLQDTLIASFGRKPLGSMPHLPPSILELLLKLRGVSSSNPRRRFDDNRLAQLGMPEPASFIDELQRYVEHLRKAR